MQPTPAEFRLMYYEMRREIARTREIIAATWELLRQSPPDTFLGRSRREADLPSVDANE